MFDDMLTRTLPKLHFFQKQKKLLSLSVFIVNNCFWFLSSLSLKRKSKHSLEKTWFMDVHGG